MLEIEEPKGEDCIQFRSPWHLELCGRITIFKYIASPLIFGLTISSEMVGWRED